MAEAIKLNKKLYPAIELMMKPTTDAHNKIVIALIILPPLNLHELLIVFNLNIPVFIKNHMNA